MRERVVLNRDTLETFILMMPEVGEKGFYRQTTSLNAFFYSKHKRNGPYSCQTLQEFERFRRVFGKYYQMSKTSFNGIWEFYAYVGYDYKSKRWLN